MQTMMLDAKHSVVMHSSCRDNVWKSSTMCFFLSLGYSAGSKTRLTQVFSCQGIYGCPSISLVRSVARSIMGRETVN